MIGSRCRLTGTELDGFIVGKKEYLGEMGRFAVRYLDAAGSPQERWFTAGEISFDGPEVEGNVVAIRSVA